MTICLDIFSNYTPPNPLLFFYKKGLLINDVTKSNRLSYGPFMAVFFSLLKMAAHPTSTSTSNLSLNFLGSCTAIILTGYNCLLS